MDRVRAMKFAKVISIGLILSTSLGSVSLADWQYTFWGMTPDQVIEASGGLAQRPASPDSIEDESTELLRAPYQAAGMEFDARFFFSNDTEKLNLVKLDLRSAEKCPVLFGQLSSRYGQPLTESESAIIALQTWRDLEAGNFVSVLQIGKNPPSSCSINYKELLSEDSGL